MQQHLLDGDGVNPELYKVLAKESKTTLRAVQLPFKVPDTIIYCGCASFWYYWSSDTNSLQRYPAKSLEKVTIYRRFTNRQFVGGGSTGIHGGEEEDAEAFGDHKRNSWANAGNGSDEDGGAGDVPVKGARGKASTIVALFIDTKSVNLDITYFTRDALKQFLFSDKKWYGVLQMYIAPRLDHVDMVQLMYSPVQTIALRRVNRAKIYDGTVLPSMRCCTFDGPTYQCEEHCCLPHVTSLYKGLCAKFVEFFANVNPKNSVERVVAYFKQDRHENYWLLFTTSVRVAEVRDAERAAELHQQNQLNYLTGASQISRGPIGVSAAYSALPMSSNTSNAGVPQHVFDEGKKLWLKHLKRPVAKYTVDSSAGSMPSPHGGSSSSAMSPYLGASSPSPSSHSQQRKSSTTTSATHQQRQLRAQSASMANNVVTRPTSAHPYVQGEHVNVFPKEFRALQRKKQRQEEAEEEMYAAAAAAEEDAAAHYTAAFGGEGYPHHLDETVLAAAAVGGGGGASPSPAASSHRNQSIGGVSGAGGGVSMQSTTTSPGRASSAGGGATPTRSYGGGYGTNSTYYSLMSKRRQAIERHESVVECVGKVSDSMLKDGDARLKSVGRMQPVALFMNDLNDDARHDRILLKQKMEEEAAEEMRRQRRENTALLMRGGANGRGLSPITAVGAADSSHTNNNLISTSSSSSQQRPHTSLKPRPQSSNGYSNKKGGSAGGNAGGLRRPSSSSAASKPRAASLTAFNTTNSNSNSHNNTINASFSTVHSAHNALMVGYSQRQAMMTPEVKERRRQQQADRLKMRPMSARLMTSYYTATSEMLEDDNDLDGDLDGAGENSSSAHGEAQLLRYATVKMRRTQRLHEKRGSIEEQTLAMSKQLKELQRTGRAVTTTASMQQHKKAHMVPRDMSQGAAGGGGGGGGGGALPSPRGGAEMNGGEAEEGDEDGNDEAAQIQLIRQRLQRAKEEQKVAKEAAAAEQRRKDRQLERQQQQQQQQEGVISDANASLTDPPPLVSLGGTAAPLPLLTNNSISSRSTSQKQQPSVNSDSEQSASNVNGGAFGVVPNTSASPFASRLQQHLQRQKAAEDSLSSTAAGVGGVGGSSPSPPPPPPPRHQPFTNPADLTRGALALGRSHDAVAGSLERAAIGSCAAISDALYPIGEALKMMKRLTQQRLGGGGGGGGGQSATASSVTESNLQAVLEHAEMRIVVAPAAAATGDEDDGGGASAFSFTTTAKERLGQSGMDPFAASTMPSAATTTGGSSRAGGVYTTYVDINHANNIRRKGVEDEERRTRLVFTIDSGLLVYMRTYLGATSAWEEMRIRYEDDVQSGLMAGASAASGSGGHDDATALASAVGEGFVDGADPRALFGPVRRPLSTGRLAKEDAAMLGLLRELQALLATIKKDDAARAAATAQEHEGGHHDDDVSLDADNNIAIDSNINGGASLPLPLPPPPSFDWGAFKQRLEKRRQLATRRLAKEAALRAQRAHEAMEAQGPASLSIIRSGGAAAGNGDGGDASNAADGDAPHDPNAATSPSSPHHHHSGGGGGGGGGSGGGGLLLSSRVDGLAAASGADLPRLNSTTTTSTSAVTIRYHNTHGVEGEDSEDYDEENAVDEAEAVEKKKAAEKATTKEDGASGAALLLDPFAANSPHRRVLALQEQMASHYALPSGATATLTAANTNAAVISEDGAQQYSSSSPSRSIVDRIKSLNSTNPFHVATKKAEQRRAAAPPLPSAATASSLPNIPVFDNTPPEPTYSGVPVECCITYPFPAGSVFTLAASQLQQQIAAEVAHLRAMGRRRAAKVLTSLIRSPPSVDGEGGGGGADGANGNGGDDGTAANNTPNTKSNGTDVAIINSRAMNNSSGVNHQRQTTSKSPPPPSSTSTRRGGSPPNSTTTTTTPAKRARLAKRLAANASGAAGGGGGSDDHHQQHSADSARSGTSSPPHHLRASGIVGTHAHFLASMISGQRTYATRAFYGNNRNGGGVNSGQSTVATGGGGGGGASAAQQRRTSVPGVGRNALLKDLRSRSNATATGGAGAGTTTNSPCSVSVSPITAGGDQHLLVHLGAAVGIGGGGVTPSNSTSGGRSGGLGRTNSNSVLAGSGTAPSAARGGGSSRTGRSPRKGSASDGPAPLVDGADGDDVDDGFGSVSPSKGRPSTAEPSDTRRRGGGGRVANPDPVVVSDAGDEAEGAPINPMEHDPIASKPAMSRRSSSASASHSQAMIVSQTDADEGGEGGNGTAGDVMGACDAAIDADADADAVGDAPPKPRTWTVSPTQQQQQHTGDDGTPCSSSHAEAIMGLGAHDGDGDTAPPSMSAAAAASSTPPPPSATETPQPQPHSLSAETADASTPSSAGAPPPPQCDGVAVKSDADAGEPQVDFLSSNGEVAEPSMAAAAAAAAAAADDETPDWLRD